MRVPKIREKDPTGVQLRPPGLLVRKDWSIIVNSCIMMMAIGEIGLSLKIAFFFFAFLSGHPQWWISVEFSPRNPPYYSDVALVFQSQIIGGCQARNQTDTSQITRKQNLIPPQLRPLFPMSHNSIIRSGGIHSSLQKVDKSKKQTRNPLTPV